MESKQKEFADAIVLTIISQKLKLNSCFIVDDLLWEENCFQLLKWGVSVKGLTATIA